MIHKLKKKLLITLTILLIIFTTIFITAVIGIEKGYSIFATGLPIYIENTIVILLSFFSILKIIHEIYHL